MACICSNRELLAGLPDPKCLFHTRPPSDRIVEIRSDELFELRRKALKWDMHQDRLDEDNKFRIRRMTEG